MTRLAVSMPDGTIDLYSFRDGKRSGHLTGYPTEAAPSAFTPDGTRLVSCNGMGDIQMWDIRTNSGIATLTRLFGVVHTVSVTGDGKHLLMCRYGDTTVVSP